MIWRLGEFDADLRENEPPPGHTAYNVELGRAAHIREEVTRLLRGAGLPVSQTPRYD